VRPGACGPGQAALGATVGTLPKNKDVRSGCLAERRPADEDGKYNEELVKAGVMLGGDGLKPSSHGKRIVFAGNERIVVDGPFSETKELVAGFWLWQVKDMNEAMEWARRCPDPMPGDEAQLELRPVFDVEDFADADPTGKHRKNDAELRKTLETRQK
jgi:hypothetical protein